MYDSVKCRRTNGLSSVPPIRDHPLRGVTVTYSAEGIKIDATKAEVLVQTHSWDEIDRLRANVGGPRRTIEEFAAIAGSPVTERPGAKEAFEAAAQQLIEGEE